MKVSWQRSAEMDRFLFYKGAGEGDGCARRGGTYMSLRRCDRVGRDYRYGYKECNFKGARSESHFSDVYIGEMIVEVN